MASLVYFEELTTGQQWTSPNRTVTESDVVQFASMTGDFDRLHVDHQYASNSRFGAPIAHGLLGVSWVAGLSSTAPAMATVALASIKEWNFLKPVYFGDTLHVITTVLDLSSAGRNAGRVVWRKSLVNQRGEEVQAGVFESIVERKSRLKKPYIADQESSSKPTNPS